MNILFISSGTGIYGANSSLLNLILILREKYNVKPYVLIRKKCDFSKRLDELNIPFFCMRFGGWVYHEKSSLKNILKTIIINIIFNYITFIKIKKKIIDFDLIHSNTSVINIGCFLSKKLHIPHIFHIREFLDEHFNIHFIYGNKYSTKYIQKYSNTIITNSKAVKNKFKQYIPDERIKVVYNGVDVKANSYLRNFSNIKNKKLIHFAMIGLIHIGKNQIEALKAVKILVNDMKMYNFKLFIIGDGDNDYCKKLTEYVNNNNLNKYVEFKGYIRNVSDFRKKMDIAIICSKMEAFGRVTVEAMFSQMPVIGSNTGGTPEIIAHGETGYLYELGNSKQLAVYMKKFIDDRMLIKKMGTKGFEKAKINFTAEMNASKIFDVYSSVLNSKNT